MNAKAMRLSLLAGHGPLVREAADAALAGGRALQVIDLVGRDDMADLDVTHTSPGKPLTIWMALRKFRPTHICMVGSVRLSDSDREGLLGFMRGKGGKTGKSGTRGDGGLSRLSAALEFATGAKVVGIHQIVDGLLADEGLIAGPKPAHTVMEQAQSALDHARALGRLDAGQALVASGERIIATEDIAGTDALIGRVGSYRADGLAGDGSAALILAKCRKPDQPENVDLPAIGPETVERAAEAGIAVIVVQSGQTLIISRVTMVKRAAELGVSVVGLDARDQAAN